MSVNKVILVGHLGKDPEMRFREGGRGNASFTLATSETYLKEGQKVTHTEWHNISVWGKLSEVVEKYLKKGSQVYIEGKIRTRQYEDKDNNKKYFTEINVETLRMLDRKPDSSGSGAPQDSPSSYAESAPYDNSAPTDDLPF